MSKEIDKALGVVENFPFKTPAQELVDSGQCPVEKPMGEIVGQQDFGDLNDAEKDYEYQRQNFYNLVERGTDAVEGILELAKESDHPRAYEVAGNLIKQVAEVTEKLGDLQEKMRKLKEVPNRVPEISGLSQSGFQYSDAPPPSHGVPKSPARSDAGNVQGAQATAFSGRAEPS